MSNNVTADPGSGGSTFNATDLTTFTAHSSTGTLPGCMLYVGAAGTSTAPTSVTTANPLPVSAAQSGTWNVTNISGTISLPTGAATAAKQPALGTAGTASSDVLSVQGIASMTALKVDGSAVTQPVSGTFWQATQPVSGTVTANAGSGSFTVAQATAASLNATVVGTGTFVVQAAQSGTWNITNISGTVSLPTGASTAAKQPALGTAGTASSDVLTVQGIASMTALKVDGSAVTQPVSGTLSITANSAVNVAQLAGTTTDTNSGVKSAGTLRVVLATDQPALTNKLLVTPDANSAVNVAQINGVTATMGNGVSGTGVLRVTVASDSTGQIALAAGSATIGALTANQTVNVAQVNGVAPSMGNGASGTGVQRVTLASDSTGQVAITGTVTVGSHAVTNAGVFAVQPGAATSGGWTPGRYVAAAGANQDATVIKASAGQLGFLMVGNIASTPIYLKLYNVASGATSASTAVQTYLVPGNSAGAGAVIPLGHGLAFSTGISFRLTTGVADNDANAVTTQTAVVSYGYA